MMQLKKETADDIDCEGNQRSPQLRYEDNLHIVFLMFGLILSQEEI